MAVKVKLKKKAKTPTHLYIYVCYPIVDRDDKNDMYAVSFSEMESFSSMELAVEFCLRNYAKYMIAVESCDEEVFNAVREGE